MELAYPEIMLPRLRYQFCPMCRAPLTREVLKDDGIPRVICPACGWAHFPSNAIGVCMIIHHAGGIVALLPPDCPPETPAALPAGHVEYGEAPETAVLREAMEETGLVVEIERCLGWYYSHVTEYPGPNVTFMYEARSVGGELRDSEEGQAVAYPLDQFPPISPRRRGSIRTMQAYLERVQGN